MTEQKRYLITTEDESTWVFGQPVIFLGEWCRLYDRQHIWQNMDAKVAKPYGLDINNKDIDDLKIKALEKKLFPKFYEILNQNFHKNYSKRFWQIIIGPWFREILELLLNRTNTLKQCLAIEDISGTTLYHSDYCSLTTPNKKSCDYFFENAKWNNVLNGRILSLINNNKITINFIEDKNSKYFYQPLKANISNKNQSFKTNIKDYFYKSYGKIAEKLVKNEDAYFINTSFNLKQLIKLQLALGQCPQLWKKIEYNTQEKPDQFLRKKLTQKFLQKSEDDLENILRILLFELLPVCYLEGFKELTKIVNQQPWPKSPKFIFTSNSFGTDEAFKMYTAIKTENGAKYYIAQHGGGYFTERHGNPRIDVLTADKFLTWGWNNKLPKYIPMFVFKASGKLINYNNKGGLLLIEQSQYPRYSPWYKSCEFLNYFEHQKKFVSQLAQGPKQKLTIRLSSSVSNIKLNETSRWLDFDRSLKIDDGKAKIRDLITDSRLVIHSYDSTGLLETFSQNIPTLAFWQNEFDHLREEVKPHYQMLVDSGILHFSVKSAANKVNEIWDDVDGWWLQSNVQDSKKRFCDIYAKSSKNPIKTMASLLIKKDI